MKVLSSSVAARILISYFVMMAAFAGSAAWSTWTFHQAGEEAELIRSGYLPLVLRLRELTTAQESWNTQLSHLSFEEPGDESVGALNRELVATRSSSLAQVRSLLQESADSPDNPLGPIARRL
ncbi:MAG: hypothetical protein MK135_05000, partial [Polyangiaceae bacterium]|nr:hypothetical protein [Polyangiaceae bacterium]